MYLPNMVEVFKTNIPGVAEFEKITHKLGKEFSKSMISFDPEDCDKVVRIEGGNDAINHLHLSIIHHGYQCEILE